MSILEAEVGNAKPVCRDKVESAIAIIAIAIIPSIILEGLKAYSSNLTFGIKF